MLISCPSSGPENDPKPAGQIEKRFLIFDILESFGPLILFLSRVCNFCTMGRGVGLGSASRYSAAPVARGRPKTTRDEGIAARLVAGEHQDEDQAVASRCWLLSKFFLVGAGTCKRTVCDLESGSLKSTSVWGPCLCFASPSLLFFSFLSSLCLPLSPSLTPSFSALVIIIILHLHFSISLFYRCFFHFTPHQTRNCHFLAVFAIFMSSTGPKSEGRYLIFRHFGRFWSPSSDLSDGQARATCETFWRVKSMFASSPCHAKDTFSMKRSTFPN